MVDGRTDRQAGRQIGIQTDIQVVEWMGWQVNWLVSWLAGWLVGCWLFETLEVILLMLSDLTPFPRKINAISDFSRQADK
jgi:hypothetical protein